MFKLNKWTKRRKWLVAGVIPLLVLVSMLGIQIVDTGVSSGVSIGIGSEKELVITLGHVALADVTVDYTYDGVADNVQFQAALNALPAGGGRLVDVSAVAKNFVATVTRAVPNVTIEGTGVGSVFNNDGGTALFTAGGNNWVFRDLSTDAGGITMGATTGWVKDNVVEGTTVYAYETDDIVSMRNDAAFTFMPSGDTDDYLTVSTAADIPTLTATGATRLEIASVTNITGGNLYINETSNADMTLGETINQGANDDEILALKSSDVNHGATTLTEIDTYGTSQKADGAAGGLYISGYRSSAGGNEQAILMDAYLDENADTTKSTAGHGIVDVRSAQISGANIANVVANGNIFSATAYVSGAWATQMLLDEDGDLWLNGGITTGGATPSARIGNWLQTTVASDGSVNYSIGNYFYSAITGFSGDTSYLTHGFFTGTIATQSVAEVIGSISTVYLSEPAITLNGGATATVAATLYIVDAPTEGVTNAAIYVVSGDTIIQRLITGGEVPLGQVQNILGGDFTSDGTTNWASLVNIPTTAVMTGFSGDTGWLSITSLSGRVSTQAVGDVIGRITQLEVREPNITLNGGATCTLAATLYIVDAPTEAATTNAAIYVASGDTIIQRLITGGVSPDNYRQNLFGGDFVSGGASSIAIKNTFEGILTGFANDNTRLVGSTFVNTIVTQNDADTIGYIAQVSIQEPIITLSGADTATVASTLYLASAPTEGDFNSSLYVYQGGEDELFIALADSDVAHGMTDVVPTNVFGDFTKVVGSAGGLSFRGFKDTANAAVYLQGYALGNTDTTKSTAGRALIETKSAQISGAAQANVVAEGNVFGIRARVGAADVTVLLIDEDGDSWQIGNITTAGGIPSSAGHIFGARYLELTEMGAPGAGGANTTRLYAFEGAGDAFTDVCAVFQDGSIDVFAQETTPLDAPIFINPSQTSVDVVMTKPHPGIIRFVLRYPDGDFVLKEIQYHDAAKIAANKGAEGPLPSGWSVTTHEERVNAAASRLHDEITAREDSISSIWIDRALLESEITSLVSAIPSLENEIAVLENEIAELDSEISPLAGGVDSLGNEVALFDNEVSLLVKEVASLENRITHLEDEIPSLENEIASLEDEILSVQRSGEFEESGLNSLAASLSTKASALGSKRNELGLKSNELGLKRSELGLARSELRAKENELGTRKHELKTKESELESKGDVLREKKEVKDRKESDVVSNQDTVEGLNQREQQLQADISDLQEKKQLELARLDS